MFYKVNFEKNSHSLMSLGATENGWSSKVNLALDIRRLFSDVGRSP